MPVLVVAPENSAAMPIFCAALRQLPSRAPLQVGTSRSRSNAAWHALVSWTRPSVAPSSASHLASTAFETSWRSAAVKAVPGCPVSVASAGRSGRRDVGDGRERKPEAGVAGEEAVVLVGVAATATIVWRPPFEQPPKYERSGRLAVGGLDHALGHRRQLPHRLVAVVEPGLRVVAERGALAPAWPASELSTAKPCVSAFGGRAPPMAPVAVTMLPSMPPLAW